MTLPRRLVLGGLLGLGGCGFRPLYLPASADGAEPVAELQRIYVPVMAERSGQLLRQALQQRFEGAGTAEAKQYELIAALSIGNDGIAIQRDNSTSRIRVDGSAPWTLRALTPERTVLAQGSSRVLDGFNIINQQVFAAELESDAAVRRVTSALADQITIQLAAYFRRRGAPT